MIRALIIGLTILHLGPGVAFALLAFGCDPVKPLLGDLCRANTLGTFAGLTVAFWVLLTAGWLAVVAWRRRAGEKSAATVS